MGREKRNRQVHTGNPEMNCNDNRTDYPNEPPALMIPISAIFRWFKDRRIKRDLDNIKEWEANHDFNECRDSDGSNNGDPEPDQTYP